MGQPVIVLQSQSHGGGAESLYVIPYARFWPRPHLPPCAVFEYQRTSSNQKEVHHGNTNMMHLKLQSAVRVAGLLSVLVGAGLFAGAI